MRRSPRPLRALAVAVCLAAGASAVAACVPPPPTGPRVLWVGDSVAWSLMLTSDRPPFDVNLKGNGRLGCGLTGGEPRYGSVWHSSPSYCADAYPSWQQDVRTHVPEVAIAQFGAWEVFDRRDPATGVVMTVGTPQWREWMLGHMRLLTDMLSEGGARVVWLTSPIFQRWVAVDGEPDSMWTAASADRVAAFNSVLREHVQRDPARNVLVDFAGWLDARGLTFPARHDGVHFHAESGVAIPAFDWVITQALAYR